MSRTTRRSLRVLRAFKELTIDDILPSFPNSVVIEQFRVCVAIFVVLSPPPRSLPSPLSLRRAAWVGAEGCNLRCQLGVTSWCTLCLCWCMCMLCHDELCCTARCCAV